MAMSTLNARTSFRALVTAAAIAAGPMLAQAGWIRQAPIPTAAELHAVSAVSATGIWAAGWDGAVVHSADNGQTWHLRQLATNSLSALFFLDETHGWAAGNGFFHTTDGGQSWTKDNDWGSIEDLFFVDAQRGFACGNGGVTYRTTDGGLSWSWSPVGPIITLSSIWFVDAQRGWTANIDGQIYRSTDGGQSWALQHDAGGYLSTLQFFDAQEGWAIGGDTFLRTTDSGQSWSPAAVPAGTWSHAARFADPLHGISVGEYGNVTRTSDGGQTWTTVSAIGSGPRLWDVESWSATQSVYAGEAGALALTNNGGAKWSPIQSGGTGATHALDAVDALHAWAANDGGEALYTVNGGLQWNRVSVAGFDNYGELQDIDFLDTSLGWAVGRDEFFGGGQGRIVRSTDGGRHWQVQYTAPGAYMEGVEVVDAQTVLALGQIPPSARFILRTTDGGQTWNDVAPSQAVFMDTDFVDANTGWVVGGKIHKTTDGGQSWTEQFTPPDLLYSVSFGDALHGWAVGWGPTLLRTTDGGQTWTPQAVNTATNALFAVEALGPDAAWISGGDGFVARTANGGQSWQPESLPGIAGAPLEALRFLGTSGWAGGYSGIWRRVTICTTSVLCGSALKAPVSGVAAER
jgi:photosystem II stability/assembly factor-like uncharacterized protein